MLEAFSLAKLAHEAQIFGEDPDNYQINYPLYIYCIKMVLNDSNLQVQAIGLQILKSMAQKELAEVSGAKNHSFFMFFTAELFGDIFNLTTKMMKKPVTRESVAITGECLTLLFIHLTLYKVGDCQKGLINLFLEATAMVVSSSADDFSQEQTEIRSTALRFVSHLAQIPSLAVQFKDVLLAMPGTRRQELQDIIRASINLDTNSAQTKSSASPLIIKIPAQREPGSKDESPVRASESSLLDTDKETFEEEEDWDAFQSFPAVADTATTDSDVGTVAAEPSSVSVLQGKFSNDDNFDGDSLRDEVSDAQHLEGADDKPILARLKEGNDTNRLHGHEETEMSEDGAGLRKKKSLGDSEQNIERFGSGGTDLHASSDFLPLVHKEPGSEAEVASEGSEELVKDFNCTNEIQEGLEKENRHASSGPPHLEYVQKPSNEAEVVSVEHETSDRDMDFTNDIQE